MIKIWSTDGKAMCVISCAAGVTGLCYVPETRILWAAAGTPSPMLYEPKSGDNISEFTRILSEPEHRNDSTLTVQLLVYEPDIKQVLGSTNQKELCVWKYSPSYCTCTQFCDTHIETLAYTNKVPILIFSGHIDGTVLKWERLQLNTFLYSHEQFVYKDKLMEALQREKNELCGGQPLIGTDPKQGILEKLYKEKVKHALETDSRSFTKSLFVESKDLLVMGSHDGRIFVWGFDTDAMKVLKELQSRTHSNAVFSTSEDTGSVTPAQESQGSVTNRVAGFTCLLSMCKHSHAISGLVAIEEGSTSFLLSASWDLLICAWDWSGKLLKCLDVTPAQCEDVKDTIITDLDWSQERSEFAYSLSVNDSCVWNISCNTLDMSERGRLIGHKREVTQIKWNPVTKNWVSGSDDETIRVWCPETFKQVDLVQAKGPVSLLMVDKTNGYIVTAVREKIHLYDQSLQLLQVNRGHSDVVRSIIHIPELNQVWYRMGHV
jgi:WD40 repeat protein